MSEKSARMIQKELRMEKAFQMWKDGADLAEIAGEFHVTEQTAHRYLMSFAEYEKWYDEEAKRRLNRHREQAASGFEWKWAIVCNRVLGRKAHPVPPHSEHAEKAFWTYRVPKKA